MAHVNKIVEIATAKASGETYLRAKYWPDMASYNAAQLQVDEPAYYMEEFDIDLRATRMVPVKDGSGWWKRSSDGVFVDPATFPSVYKGPGGAPMDIWEMEEVTNDIEPRIERMLNRHWTLVVERGWVGDHTLGTKTKRDQTDPHNVLVRDDMKALVDTVKVVA